MVRTYKILHVDTIKNNTPYTREMNIDKLFDFCDKAFIDCYPWDNSGYKPLAFASILYDIKGMYIKLQAFEEIIIARYLKNDDPVYKDSCMEFFLNAFPAYSQKYLNFEFNPFGTMLLGFGSSRTDRVYIGKMNNNIFNIKSGISKNHKDRKDIFSWHITFFIPFEFLHTVYEINSCIINEMKGNFYKCGDDTSFPHYGCWNNIDKEYSDFHCPEFFGNLILNRIQ